MIRITSKVNGFRRAGLAHPAGPTDYPDDAFTEEQLALLTAEPMLVVSYKPASVLGLDDKPSPAGAAAIGDDAKAADAAAESQPSGDSAAVDDAAAPAAPATKPASAAKGGARKAGAQ